MLAIDIDGDDATGEIQRIAAPQDEVGLQTGFEPAGGLSDADQAGRVFRERLPCGLLGGTGLEGPNGREAQPSAAWDGASKAKATGTPASLRRLTVSREGRV